MPQNTLWRHVDSISFAIYHMSSNHIMFPFQAREFSYNLLFHYLRCSLQGDHACGWLVIEQGERRRHMMKPTGGHDIHHKWRPYPAKKRSARICSNPVCTPVLFPAATSRWLNCWQYDTYRSSDSRSQRRLGSLLACHQTVGLNLMSVAQPISISFLSCTHERRQNRSLDGNKRRYGRPSLFSINQPHNIPMLDSVLGSGKGLWKYGQ